MELARINLNLLISLYYLLHSKSVTAAAGSQHISQPAMSRNLNQLREIFNDSLLVRVGNTMQLTPRGVDERAVDVEGQDFVIVQVHQEVPSDRE